MNHDYLRKLIDKNIPSKRIRLSLDVSPELNDLLETIAQEMCTTKSQVLRKCIALFEIAVREKQKGNYLGIFNHDQKIVKEITGL